MTEEQGALLNTGPEEVILTVNRRLATHLQSQYDQHCLAHQSTWITPAIMPLSTWLIDRWQNTLQRRLLLDNTLSRFVWESIIEQACADYPLLDSQRAASQAQEAWNLLHQWQVPLEELEQSDSEDVSAFVSWAKSYQARCNENHWCDVAQLTANITQSLDFSTETIPQKHFIVGFDTLPPATQRLMTVLSQHSEVIVELFPPLIGSSSFIQRPFPPPALCTQRVLLNDREAEFHAMAQWAKQQWQANPQQSIACIVPDLLAERSRVVRLFSEEFEWDLSAVNIAGGECLMQYPIIAVVITLIRFLSGRSLTQSLLTSVLLSPHLRGAESEGQQRAVLDQYCRRTLPDSCTLYPILSMLRDSGRCPELYAILNAAQALFKELPGTQLPSRWAKLFSEILTLLAWPGDQTLSSTEYQQVNNLQQQLRRYAGLDAIIGKQSVAAAQKTLSQLLSEALFQAESDFSAPIQVLGLLEATGFQFDQLWLCSMNDDIWPPSPAPNPFIPIDLQRTIALPRSSGAHELQYAQQIMHRLQHSTRTLIASYSQQKPDENRELAISPMIQTYTPTSLEALHLALPIPFIANPQTVVWRDDYAPPIQSSEKIRGGATILKLQAQCPFWAFAEIRLAAKPFDEIELGVSPALRGSLVHAVLAKLWQNLGSSEALHSMSEEELTLCVHHCIETVLNSELPTEDAIKLSDLDLISARTQIRNLESQRLHLLIKQWLSFEKKRPAFTVTAIEQPFELRLGPLNLHLQVDRIDSLSDGSQIIIDYKTGTPSPSSWFGDRPDEPQLPLYALQKPYEVRGLAFAQIRAQSVKFNGITAEAGQLPGVKKAAAPWSTLIDEWQSTLTALAEDFYAGDAAVSPKKFPGTCAYCHLAPVCRINEKEAQ